MAVVGAWRGSFCVFSKQQLHQQIPAFGISRECCSCYSSAVSSSSFIPSWTVKSRNRSPVGRRGAAARFTVLASQEAGISTHPSAAGATTASSDLPAAQTAPTASNSKQDEAGETEPAKPKPMPKPAAPAAADTANPTPKRAAKKPAAVKKSLEAAMLEDVMPQLTTTLEKEEGLTDLNITFEANQLKTSFSKGGIPYCHWAFFPDGTLEGSRGASLTSYGSPPSTIEPFLVDENKITPELVVFWIRKRLFAQKILSVN